MLTLILAIIIGFMIFCEIKIINTGPYSGWEIVRIFTIPALVVAFTMWIGAAYSITECRIVDQKIKMYQQQNKEIEEKIEVVVKNYMDFENDTFTDLKSDSYINLVSLYPDLKSDELVKQQIALYTQNNNTITELKEEKLNETIYRWWLYFGK